MNITRRAFLRHLGITLSSMILASCKPGERLQGSAQERIHQAWLDLEILAKRTQISHARGKALKEHLTAEHRAALDEIVANGEMDTSVADAVHIAFVNAASHVYQSNGGEAGIQTTCYEIVRIGPNGETLPVEVYPWDAPPDLAKQAELLTEMASQGTLEPGMADLAQIAITNDLEALFMETITSPDAKDAAQFLVELLGQPNQ